LYSEKEHHKVVLLEDYLDQLIVTEPLPPIHLLEKTPLTSAMETLQIDGGKKQKVRAGDILGALTGKDGCENSIPGAAVGKINIADNWAYVAVSRDVYKMALQKLGQGKLKGRSFRVRLIRD
jgi:ATP-independent RNA helicase DbpA